MATVDVVSEVTGTVWKLEAEIGQQLVEDDTLLIIESMKMEIPLLAPESGRLLEILVAETDAVSEGQLLARLETD
jgi:acetyl-CoA carboxylase biotin carboxyl carrier protein